jgi:uncharacterized membrane protein
MSATKSIFGLIRARLLAGVFALLPVALTIWVVAQVILFADKISQPILIFFFGAPIRGFGIVVTLVAIYIVGGVVQNRLLSRFLAVGGRIVNRIPLAGTLYSALRQTTDAFSMSNGDERFSRVVMVEYPRREMWTVALVTREIKGGAKNRLCLYVPTTPNPTSGFALIVDADQVKETNMSVEEAVKFIISVGMVAPPNVQDSLSRP